MKKLIFLLFIPVFCATTCDDDPCDDNGYSFVNYDLVKVKENQTSYAVGDTLWLDAVVSRNQILQYNQSNYDLFSKNETLSYFLNMFKNPSSGNGQVFLNTENLISIKGKAENNHFTLTKEGNTFANKTGIKLTESGNFKISVDDISSYGSSGCNSSVQIQTKILNSDEDNNFNFNVR
ncbi:hypothetical protein [uncultured Flavobacterium sp.]|uniref:hypothetical protein n=1 Tax=uncultured Flavobacterium sp. TaxID=165435 RepID=UPI00260122C5|nr:hypothetical protein [uncultured Flavobacterium sp.]